VRRIARSGDDGGVWIAAVSTGPITCQVMHVGPFMRVAVAAPRPPLYLPPDSPADRPGISRHQSRTLADTRHNSRAVRGHKSPTQSIHDQSPRRPARGGWHVPPLGTAVWRCLTARARLCHAVIENHPCLPEFWQVGSNAGVSALLSGSGDAPSWPHVAVLISTPIFRPSRF